MRRARDWLVALVLLALSRRPRTRNGGEDARVVPAGDPDRRAESVVLLLFVLAALCAAAFVVVYAVDLPRPVQAMGAALGLSFAFLAAALIVIAKRLVVEEELEEEYPPPLHAEEADELARLVEESGSRFTRKRLLWTAGGAAGGLLGLALATPAVSLGPLFETAPFYSTPWRRGLRLVDEAGRPLLADEIEEGVLYTAFPEGESKDLLASPLAVVRLEPAALALPPGREGWAPGGILAYSIVCTHAGCAVSMLRAPKFAPVEPAPALVCPCHYSTFDPAAGGAVVFGPAGRPLPQLPLSVGEDGFLRAGGDYSGPVGPSWWGVRMREPE